MLELFCSKVFNRGFPFKLGNLLGLLTMAHSIRCNNIPHKYLRTAILHLYMSPTALRQQKRNRGASPSVERIFENAVPFSFENGPLMEKSRRFFPADRGPDDHIKRYYHGTKLNSHGHLRQKRPWAAISTIGANIGCQI